MAASLARVMNHSAFESRSREPGNLQGCISVHKAYSSTSILDFETTYARKRLRISRCTSTFFRCIHDMHAELGNVMPHHELALRMNGCCLTRHLSRTIVSKAST